MLVTCYFVSWHLGSHTAIYASMKCLYCMHNILRTQEETNVVFNLSTQLAISKGSIVYLLFSSVNSPHNLIRPSQLAGTRCKACSLGHMLVCFTISIYCIHSWIRLSLCNAAPLAKLNSSHFVALLYSLWTCPSHPGRNEETTCREQ